jgi:hypothetical protein
MPLFSSSHCMGSQGSLFAKKQGCQIRFISWHEFGVAPKDKMMFYRATQSIVSGEDKDFVYLKPQLQAKVKMRNWTKSGMLRSPVFERFVM